MGGEPYFSPYRVAVRVQIGRKVICLIRSAECVNKWEQVVNRLAPIVYGGGILALNGVQNVQCY